MEADLSNHPDVLAAVAQVRAEYEAETAREVERIRSQNSEVCVQARAEVRERCKAILLSNEAKGRFEVAKALALETDLSAEEAVKVLAKIPVPVEPVPPRGRWH